VGRADIYLDDDEESGGVKVSVRHEGGFNEAYESHRMTLHIMEFIDQHKEWKEDETSQVVAEQPSEEPSMILMTQRPGIITL
jgi:hypothetical protein